MVCSEREKGYCPPFSPRSPFSRPPSQGSELPQQLEADPPSSSPGLFPSRSQKGCCTVPAGTSWPQGDFPGNEVEVVWLQPAACSEPLLPVGRRAARLGRGKHGKGPFPGTPLPSEAEVTCGLSRRQEGPSAPGGAWRLCLQERSLLLFLNQQEPLSWRLLPLRGSLLSGLSLRMAIRKESSSGTWVQPLALPRKQELSPSSCRATAGSQVELFSCPS